MGSRKFQAQFLTLRALVSSSFAHLANVCWAPALLRSWARCGGPNGKQDWQRSVLLELMTSRKDMGNILQVDNTQTKQSIMGNSDKWSLKKISRRLRKNTEVGWGWKTALDKANREGLETCQVEGREKRGETVPDRGSNAYKSPEGRRSWPVWGPQGGWYRQDIMGKRRGNEVKLERKARLQSICSALCIKEITLRCWRRPDGRGRQTSRGTGP